jgi:methyl-accepting chemotaxis protein/methyl-accepting chemotaxis protein-1 (serine sensor receptor)
MKVSTKLYSTVGALALIGILVASGGIWCVRMLGNELAVATDKTAVKLDLVNAARARSWEMVAALRGVFVFASLKHQQELESSTRRWEASYKRINEQIREIRPLLVSEQGKRDLARFESGLSEFQKVAVDYVRLCRERDFERIAGLSPKIVEFTTLADETLNSLKNQQRAVLKESQTRAESLRSQSLMVNLSLSMVLLGIATLAALVVRSVNRTLVTAVTELSRGADQVAVAASQVSASSHSLAQGSSEQAASLEETSASSEEINSMARSNSENSDAAANLVSSSQQKFVDTNHSLEQTVAAMGEINEQSGKISKIIKTIDEIAFQTNILALNAAVEAARAGEAGMGFAVVADEVRNLAQRCAQAAKDTAELIEESIARSDDGKAKVDQVALAIRAITVESGKVKTLVDEVNLGSKEQARGIEQIGRAITQMEQVTQRTAANAEESASAAEELNAQSRALKAVVSRLSAMVGGEREFK